MNNCLEIESLFEKCENYFIIDLGHKSLVLYKIEIKRLFQLEIGRLIQTFFFGKAKVFFHVL